MANIKNSSRLIKEFQDCQKNNKDNNIQVRLVNNKYNHWKGSIKGPVNSCYEGGIFEVNIIIPDDYPFSPPKIKFDTTIYHPNISYITGEICLDILKKKNWIPELSIMAVLISLQSLMCEPVPNDPQNLYIAKQYMTDINLFKKTAKLWVEEYANPLRIYEKKINEIKDMGFSEIQAKNALKKTNEDVEKAINILVGAL